MKRWFKTRLITSDLWEWDSENHQGRWVRPSDGTMTASSDLDIRLFDGYDHEVFPTWGFPKELQLPEGL